MDNYERLLEEKIENAKKDFKRRQELIREGDRDSIPFEYDLFGQINAYQDALKKYRETKKDFEVLKEKKAKRLLEELGWKFDEDMLRAKHLGTGRIVDWGEGGEYIDVYVYKDEQFLSTYLSKKEFKLFGEYLENKLLWTFEERVITNNGKLAIKK